MFASRAATCRRRQAAGVAAVEMALVVPVLSVMLMILVDAGRAFQQRSEIVAAVSAGAEFAYLAAQHGTAAATIRSETVTTVVSTSNALLASRNITVTINDGNSPSDRCCVSAGTGGAASWTCGTASAVTTCADGSNPGVYVQIAASVAFSPYFSADTQLTGTTLSSSIIERVE